MTHVRARTNATSVYDVPTTRFLPCIRFAGARRDATYHATFKWGTSPQTKLFAHALMCAPLLIIVSDDLVSE